MNENPLHKSLMDNTTVTLPMTLTALDAYRTSLIQYPDAEITAMNAALRAVMDSK